MKLTTGILMVMLSLCAFAVAQEIIFTELPETEQAAYFELCVKRGDYGLKLLQERRAAAADAFLAPEERANKLDRIDEELRRLAGDDVTVKEVHEVFVAEAEKRAREAAEQAAIAAEQAAADEAAAKEAAAREAAAGQGEGE